MDLGLREREWGFVGWQLALLVVIFAAQQVLAAWREHIGRAYHSAAFFERCCDLISPLEKHL